MLKSRIVNICFAAVLFIVVCADVFMATPFWVYIVPLILYAAIQAYGSIVLSAAFFIPVKYKASSSTKAIALSFDDGPVTEKTEKVLEILKAHQASAIFFCIGNHVSERPDLVKRIHAEGHLLGNHSYWHGKTFDLQSTGKIADELQETDAAIRKCIGFTPRFFRPPYGVTNPMVGAAVRSGNYVTVGWSIRSFDTVIKDSSRLLRRLTTRLKGGDIILFHDHSDSMLEILPAFLKHVSELGLKIVRIDELLNEKAYV
jgi:peptidoglycan-N-acetylglucosamine deacetylase